MRRSGIREVMDLAGGGRRAAARGGLDTGAPRHL